MVEGEEKEGMCQGLKGVVYDDHGWEAHRLCSHLRMEPHDRPDPNSLGDADNS